MKTTIRASILGTVFIYFLTAACGRFEREANPFIEEPEAPEEIKSDYKPTDFTKLALWLDAGESFTWRGNTFYLEKWESVEPEDIPVSQSEENRQPYYRKSVLNKRPAIYFDGTDDYLDGGNILSLTADLTFFIVHKVDGTAENRLLSRSSGGLTAQYELRISSKNTASFISNVNGELQRVDSNTYDMANFHILVCTVTSGERVDFYFNNAYGGGGALDPSGTFSVETGEHFLIGARNYSLPDLFYKGEIAEVIVYEKSLGTSDREKVIDYLKAKYAL